MMREINENVAGVHTHTHTHTHTSNLKNKKGITLVALIVTIIILLILAGVSIATLTESGLFEKARQAEQKSENAQIQEETILADYENKIGEYVDSSRDTVTIDKEEYEQLKNASNYSYDEKVIGTYADSSTLYKRTFSGTTPSTNSELIDISTLNIKQIVSIYGVVNKGDNQTTLPIGLTNNADYISVFYRDGYIHYRANTGFHSLPYILTIEYTKNN